ncbi:MAG: hypothetical protein NTV79_09655 [Candidatus Aureabacteria bacterium]|nr:hypothetical protein [Candidatus Auribacterota bacterium]
MAGESRAPKVVIDYSKSLAPKVVIDYSKSLAPKGRSKIARGFSPWTGNPHNSQSPGGAIDNSPGFQPRVTGR